jgi:hypothetical protein
MLCLRSRGETLGEKLFIKSFSPKPPFQKFLQLEIAVPHNLSAKL